MVSVCVVSYNAEKTIIETLESIKDQTYSKIELIVSDDASKDRTCSIAEEWIAKNKSKFINATFISVEKNTGVCANLNRALSKCNGQWVKIIAADDKLLPSCISDFVDFIQRSPEAYWVAGLARMYKGNFHEENCFRKKYTSKESFYDESSEKQLKILALDNIITAPTLFINTELIKKVGGYDETLSFEDYAFNLRALELGYKCFLMKKETVCYRIADSISHKVTSIFNYKFLLEIAKFKKDRCFKYMTKNEISNYKSIFMLQRIIHSLNLNHNNSICIFIYRAFYSIISRIYRG